MIVMMLVVNKYLGEGGTNNPNNISIMELIDFYPYKSSVQVNLIGIKLILSLLLYFQPFLFFFWGGKVLRFL